MNKLVHRQVHSIHSNVMLEQFYHYAQVEMSMLSAVGGRPKGHRAHIVHVHVTLYMYMY